MNPSTLLIVEDEAIVAADLAEKLTQLGYEIISTVARGDDAVTLALTRKPDLVLMDIHLQGPIDGIAAAEQIKAQSHIPVVFLTAHSDPRTLERAKITEPFGYILKPFEERELHTVVEIALHKHQAEERLRQSAQELRLKNEELKRANLELDTFAHVAAHDLKEPLRNIHNYSASLLENHADKLDDGATQKLQSMMRLTARMDSLLGVLLHYSRLIRTGLTLQLTDVTEVLDYSLQRMQASLKSTSAEIRIPGPLGSVQADDIRLEEVFVNLIENALKYNDKAQKWVEIGVIENADAPPVFYVRDNGLGIDAKHHNNIFNIFRRLHGREQYGGGVGAGLTMVKRIIELHGGRIWLESEVGIGSTFYFTLG